MVALARGDARGLLAHARPVPRPAVQSSLPHAIVGREARYVDSSHCVPLPARRLSATPARATTSYRTLPTVTSGMSRAESDEDAMTLSPTARTPSFSPGSKRGWPNSCPWFWQASRGWRRRCATACWRRQAPAPADRGDRGAGSRRSAGCRARRRLRRGDGARRLADSRRPALHGRRGAAARPPGDPSRPRRGRRGARLGRHADGSLRRPVADRGAGARAPQRGGRGAGLGGRLARPRRRPVPGPSRRPRARSAQDIGDANGRKTGALFLSAVELGAIVAGATPGQRANLSAFAGELGLAFQLMDDLSTSPRTRPRSARTSDATPASRPWWRWSASSGRSGWWSDTSRPHVPISKTVFGAVRVSTPWCAARKSRRAPPADVAPAIEQESGRR